MWGYAAFFILTAASYFLLLAKLTQEAPPPPADEKDRPETGQEIDATRETAPETAPTSENACGSEPRYRRDPPPGGTPMETRATCPMFGLPRGG